MLSVSYWQEQYWGGANRLKQLCTHNRPRVVYFKTGHASEWGNAGLVRHIVHTLLRM